METNNTRIRSQLINEAFGLMKWQNEPTGLDAKTKSYKL